MKEAALNVLKTLIKYKVYIVIGVGVAIAAGGGSAFLVTQKAKKNEFAWQNLWRINDDLATATQQAKTEKDKTAALNATADAYKYLRDNISSSSATPWIIFQLGNVYYRLKNYDEAIRAYHDFLARYSGHSLAPVVKQSLGYAYEEKGLYQEAVKQFEDISANSRNFLVAQGNWDAGRCYEKLGQTNDAIRSYTKTIELSPNSNWATMSQYRLTVIR
ncbi:MAG: tetratricopeptide repeat protein [Candidatus Brocadia sp.]|nr:tetratricopeptide repeat protein [Candidatus Brocadia sp.]MDG6025717.1 tetratricopeptide repeat protein [Candidatus Brocadia sp.]